MTGRLPGLDQYDRATSDDWHSDPSGHSATYPARQGGSKQNLPTLSGTGGCWCGQAYGHSDGHAWPARPRIQPVGHEHCWANQSGIWAGSHTGRTCLICGRPQVLPEPA